MPKEIIALIAVLSIIIVVLIFITINILKTSNSFIKKKDIFEIEEDLNISIEEAKIQIREIARRYNKIRCFFNPRMISKSIKRNAKILRRNHLELLKTPEAYEELIPSVKWVTDNFYIINIQIKAIEEQFNKKNLKKIPLIEYGDNKAYPRIFVVVKEIVQRIGFHFSEDRLKIILEEYQEISPLTIGELWLLPIVIKICYLELILKVSDKTLMGVKSKNDASKKVNKIISNNDNRRVIMNNIAEMIKYSDEANDLDFLSHVIYILRERGINDDEFLDSLTKTVFGEKESSLSIIRSEARIQSELGSKASILIGSLKRISDLDWGELFEEICVVDEILGKEQCGVYKEMSLDTKNHYRNKIERISQLSGIEETDIAYKTLKLTEEKEGKESHVGYYLVDRGIKTLYKSFNVKFNIFKVIKLFLRSQRVGIYFSLITLFSLGITFLLAYYTFITLNSNKVLLTSLFVIPMGIITLCFVIDQISGIFEKHISRNQPKRMNFEKGIPEEYRSIVVIPTIIANEDDVDVYIDKLEDTYIANKDNNLVFALLADFPDSENRENPGEEDIRSYANVKIHQLNRTYGKDRQVFFSLFRYRKWNEKENTWMGWERKRGKIEEFNKLLLGSKENSYIAGNDVSEKIGKVKYVITIDSDTELVKGSAHKLIGIMAHILNHPELNEKGTRVIRGYGIIQPRIDTKLDSYLKTPFSRLFSGRVGVEPYAYASSDIYQDLFSEGTFVGKGIYDLEIFSKVLDGAIPENAVLSHDLLEGGFARNGLSADIQLADAHPTNVLSFYSREHRWIRGDWQLIPWIFRKNKLGSLTKWKMLMNLIRSLLPVSYLIYFAFIPILLNWNIWVYLSFVLFTIAATVLPTFSKRFLGCFFGVGFRYCLKTIFQTIFKNIFMIFYMIAILPYRAYIALDAIFRTLWRLMFSKKRLLNWLTAEAVERKIKGRLIQYLKKMMVNIVFGALLIIVAFFFIDNLINQIVLYVLGGLYVLAPIVSYVMGTSYSYKKVKLSGKNNKELYDVARKTWRYFEELFTEKWNYLVPDNYQVLDKPKAALRTSPTNIGLQLMAFVSARDFGFISINDFLDMVDKTLETIEKLPKWHGNLYNWYDISNLEQLNPHYVSSVDSGNFIGFLISLKQAIIDILEKPVFSANNLNGIKDVLTEVGFAKIDFDKMEIKNIAIFIKDAISDIDNSKNAWVNREYSNWARVTLLGYLIDLDNFMPLEKSIMELCGDRNRRALILKREADALVCKIDNIIQNTELNRMYNHKKNLFHIGYNVASGEADNSYYDLLASEARITSFLAIAKNEVPQKHWYKLSRPMTLVQGDPVLMSWNGTMFEYFMPHLIMNAYPKTTIDGTLKGVIDAQKKFAKRNKVPFGISESAYYRFDDNLNYQYRGFGVPGLGFKADLSKFLVIAPYASIMAIHIDPISTIKNLRRIRKEGGYGRYGFYEAIDYISYKEITAKKARVIKTFMCHHQGMIIMALDNLLHNDIHRKRFHREPMVRANQFILEETKLLGKVVNDNVFTRVPQKSDVDSETTNLVRIINKTNLNCPVTHVMSNDKYQIMVDSNGLGFSKYQNIFINFWEKDWTANNYGNYIYIKNLTFDKYYSTTYKPTLTEPSFYEARFALEKAEFLRIDDDIESKMEIINLIDLNGEIRRVTLTNRSKVKTKLEITGYMDLILDKRGAFTGHPAFSKLFVETEYDSHFKCVIATRRQKEEDETTYYLGATCIFESSQQSEFDYDTDRNFFIGRGRDLRKPNAMDNTFMLGKTVGEIVDPCIAMKTYIELDPGEHKSIAFIYIISENKAEIGPSLQSFRSAANIHDKITKSVIDSKLEMSYLNLDYNKANAILDVTSSIFYSLDIFRAKENILKRNVLAQKDLWKFGISGDNAIILVLVNELDEIDTVKDSVVTYEYMRRNQIEVDLVVINLKQEGYQRELTLAIGDVLYNARTFESDKKAKGVFEINRSELSEDEFVLLMSVANIIWTGKDRILGNKSKEYRQTVETNTSSSKYGLEFPSKYPAIKREEFDLKFFNSYGGFDVKNDEYVIILDKNKITPMPWINVIANYNFGCLCSESGMGYTYRANSRENKISSWVNDPIIDSPPEIVYIKDDLTNKVFTITSAPIRKKGEYIIKHGFGYTEYNYNNYGLKMNQIVFTPLEKNFKYVVVTLENKTNETRVIETAYYVELVLGDVREKALKYTVTDVDESKKILRAYNRYNDSYKDAITYLYCDSNEIDYTCDKNEFMGYVETKATPIGMEKVKLLKKTGISSNPCLVLKGSKTLKPNETISFVYILGQEDTNKDIIANVDTYGNLNQALVELGNVKDFWKKTLSTIQIKTSNEKMNIMLNGWLMYQSLGCRIMARTAYYQASGAFGFRDQLQDCAALFYCNPEKAREIIVNATKHQFIEGDVLHWWHADTGVGIRTKFTDDLLWLPYILHRYIKITGDKSILDEETYYLTWDLLGPNEYEKFGVPQISHEKGSIYEHAKKSIQKSLSYGENGLPLMGIGDWNDGMSRVGHEGKGESVWLGWFLYKTAANFLHVAEIQKDTEFIEVLNKNMIFLKKNLNKNAWDGEWYLRAFFDDGTKMGSKEQSECKIDLISQAWSVISGAGEKKKTEIAMKSIKKYLIDEHEKVIALLSPPFHRSKPNPGYIQGYLKGVRENGGQYTHGAIWAVYAYSLLNDNEMAFQLFDMLNPISHTEKPFEVEKYKLEPYVVCADIYYNNLQKGRGGWSFYTGSAGWLYRAGLEKMLGFIKEGDKLFIQPNVPSSFEDFSIEYNYGKSKYIINVKLVDKENVGKVIINDIENDKDYIPLKDNGKEYNVVVKVPR